MKILITLGMLSFVICFQYCGNNYKYALSTKKPPPDTVILNATDLLPHCRVTTDAELQTNDFIDSSWVTTVVQTKSNETYTLRGRYHVANDEIQLLINEINYTLIGSKVGAVILGKEEFMHHTYIEGSEEREGYLKQILSGHRSLFSRYKHSEGKELAVKFYSTTDNKLPQRFNTKKKAILKLLRDRKLPMYHFIQVNKLQPTNEKDLLRIFEHYNTLLES